MIGSPPPSSGQLVISDRATECGGKLGGSDSALAEPWSLTGQGDRSFQVSPQHVCLRVCLQKPGCHDDVIPTERVVMHLWVGGWVLWPRLDISAYFICVSYHAGLIWCYLCFPDPASAGAGRGSRCDNRQGAEL